MSGSISEMMFELDELGHRMPDEQIVDDEKYTVWEIVRRQLRSYCTVVGYKFPDLSQEFR